MNDDDVLFYSNFNVACTFLSPEDRKLVNSVLQVCDLFDIPFREALSLSETDPKALPPAVYWTLKFVDDAGVFQRVIDLCVPQTES